MTLTVALSGISLSANSKLTFTLPAGAIFNTAAPTCTSNNVIVTLTTCTYSSQTLEVFIGAVATTISSWTFTASNFVNPSTAIDQWPLTGGVSAIYNASGFSYGPSKITGFDATALTAASITYFNSSFNQVGLSSSKIKVSLTPSSTFPTNG